MTDFFFPTNVIPSASQVTYLDTTARFQSALSGAVRTVSRPGERIRLTLNFTNLSAGKRSQLFALVSKLRGGSNRVFIPLHGMAARGSFPGSELFTNAKFSNGTTGWGVYNNVNFNDVDGAVTLAPISNFSFGQTISTHTQFAAYICRSFTSPGRGMADFGFSPLITIDSAAITAATLTTTRGLQTTTATITSTSDNQYMLGLTGGNAFMVGDYIILDYATFQRCALADGGGNLLLRSEDFTTTWTNTRTTDAANTVAAPDGTTTADSIIEDSTASNTHYIQQSATVAATANLEYCGSVYLKAGTRTWAAVVLVEGTGSGARQYVNLSTGALGTSATGGNWADQRAFVTDAGDGWYRVDVVARKTNTNTSLTLRIELATGDNTNTYTGNGTSLIYAWGGQLNQSSNPVRYTATTTASVATASQTGTGIYVKGLPTSTNGLLVAGDWVEIGGELHQVAQALNSDGHGLGYLVLGRPVRAAKANEAAVIIGEPLGKFLLEDGENGWSNAPGNFSDATLTFIEDIAA